MLAPFGFLSLALISPRADVGSAAALPTSFLSDAAFSRAQAAHRNIGRLRGFAPAAFTRSPPEVAFSDDISLVSDLGIRPLCLPSPVYLASALCPPELQA